MDHLYLSGARQRELLIKREEEYNLYDNALICFVDTHTHQAEPVVNYQTPAHARASSISSCAFKSGTVVDNILYICTNTEVLLFELPSMQRVGYVSLPCFNDVHHVTPSSDGTLLAVSTGLDMVLRFDRAGNVIEEWSTLGEAPWARFSQQIDYRKVETTKPHLSHPNYVFELGREVWVTRCHQRDAICLSRPGNRIDIAVERVHDGLLFNERLYFTTVDGRVVVVDPRSLQVESIFDLNTFHPGEPTLLGWCRGILPLDERRIWVGFTRVRKTKFRENLLWVKRRFKDGVREMPTHIALYDIAERRCLQQIDLERWGMNLVFGIFGADSSIPKHGVLRATPVELGLEANSA